MKERLLIVPFILAGFIFSTSIIAQQEKPALTLEQHAKVGNIREGYVRNGVPYKMAEKRALSVFESIWNTASSFVRDAEPFSGSIWIDRNATGMDYSDYHSYTPEEFVQKIFVKNATETGTDLRDIVKNVKFNGEGWDESMQEWVSDNRSLHYFNRGDAVGFQIEKGILLATGSALAAEKQSSLKSGLGGGAATKLNYFPGSLAPDADLQGVIPQSLCTQTVLEFDFQPFTDVVSFNYIFASAEFKNFSDSSFNDAIGFFITGPGLEDECGNAVSAINIARYPNGAPVTVNTSDLEYRSGGASGLEDDVETMEYGDHTILLTAQANLKKGEWYHLKLVIANAGDAAFGSGVFLEAGSFDIGIPEIVPVIQGRARQSVLNPVDYIGENAENSTVWSDGSMLHIKMEGSSDVRIYTLAGLLHKQIRVNNSASIQLSAGFYIVSVGDKQYKVMMK